MTPEPLVGRLHRALVEEILVRRPEYLRSPFTVAEIYQELVPYRTHRDRIGASMNGDYEAALLRLLAGEGDYLRIDSEPARKRMAEELGSSNPNTGLFREFAALDVRLNPAFIPTEEEARREAVSHHQDDLLAARLEESLAEGEEDEAPEEAEVAAPEPAAMEAPSREGVLSEEETAGTVTAPEDQPPPLPEDQTTDPTPSPRSTEAPESCHWCRQELPRRDNLRFCPFCGTDVRLVPCPQCGEEVEPEWRFCIACGTEVASE